MRGDFDDEMEGGKKPSRPGLPVDVHRILGALRQGRRWLALAAGVGVLLGLLIGVFVVQRTYQAEASIRYDGLPGQAPHEAQRDLPAMVSITHSEPVLSELRDRVGMDGVSLEVMQRLVEVESDAGSGLVTFKTAAHSAEGAAEMANTLSDVFLDRHRERRQSTLRSQMSSVSDRIEAAQRELQAARRTYDQFRQTQGITDLSAEQEEAISQAASLRSEADLAQATIDSLQARVRQLEQQLESTPEMEASSSGASRGGRRVAELQQRLREARGAGYGEAHPQIQSLESQIAALRRSGGSATATRMTRSSHYEQIQTALSEAQAELEAARQRRESLEALATQAHQRTNRFSTIEGEAANLLAQVNVKEALVTDLTERRARLEDELRDVPTGFSTVSRALPPESAVPSKKKWLVGAGIPLAFVGIMMGMLLFRELKGLRVKTPAEVAWWGNGPVIGTTTWPRDPRALIDLIADMDDYAPDARGTMLVVGASEAEREPGEEIAKHLNQDWSSTTLIDLPVVGALPSGGGGADAGEAVDVEVMSANEPGDDAAYEDERPGEAEPGGSDSAIMLTGGATALGVMGGTAIDGYSGSPDPDIDDPDERLVCSAWTGPSEGQALRRAARLADRVLVVVSSNGMKAPELAQVKARLGRESAVGFVLIGVTEDVSRLPDRAGPVDAFWAALPV